MYKSIISISLVSILLSCGSSLTEEAPLENAQENIEETALIDNSSEVELIIEDVDADKFKAISTKEGTIILDVRTPEEFNEGHVTGAININFYGEGFEAALDTLAKDKNVVVYCMAGGRSGKTSRLLNDKGFSKVYNLENGFGNYPYRD